MNIFENLTLPNGSIIPNRIAKAAMEENMANVHFAPSEQLIRLYQRWADGGHTEINNGMALCKACHKFIHGGGKMNIVPRGWQKLALRDFAMHKQQ